MDLSKKYKLISSNLFIGIHSFFLILSAIIGTFSFYLIESPIFNIMTYFLTISLIFILFITAIFAHNFRIRLLDYILLVFYLYLIPRLLQYGFDPKNVFFPQNLELVGLSVVNINNGFFSLLICLSIFFSTIILIYAYLNNKKYYFSQTNTEKKYFPLSNFIIIITFICFILMTLLEYIIYSNPENSILALGIYEKAKTHILLKVFLTIFSSDMFMYFLLFFLIIDKTLNKKILFNKKIMIFIFLSIIFYCYIGAIMGSRGVGLRIILSVLAIFIISPLNFQNFKYTFIIIIFSFLASFIVLFVGQKTRYDLNLENKFSGKTACVNCLDSTIPLPLTKTAPPSKLTKNPISSIPLSSIPPQLTKTAPPSKLTKNPISSIPPQLTKTAPPSKLSSYARNYMMKSYVFLFNRMNYFDYFIISLSKEPEKKCKEKYLNSQYYYKNVINFLMPGDPYPEAIISTTNVFGLCYRPEMYKNVDSKGLSNFDRSTYTSQVWSAFGLMNIHSQDWMYFYVFLFSGLVGLISFFLSKWNNQLGKIIYSYFVYTTPFTLIFSMGVDHSIMVLIVIILRGFAMCLSLYLIEKMRILLLKLGCNL